jgi:hypothetical protein
MLQLETLQRMLPVDMWFKDLTELEEGLQVAYCLFKRMCFTCP